MTRRTLCLPRGRTISTQVSGRNRHSGMSLSCSPALPDRPTFPPHLPSFVPQRWASGPPTTPGPQPTARFLLPCLCPAVPSPGMPFPHSLPSEAPAPFEAQLQCHFLQKAFPDALLVPTLLDLLPFTENPADVPLTELVAVSSLGRKLLEVTRDMILLSMMPDTGWHIVASKMGWTGK